MTTSKVFARLAAAAGVVLATVAIAAPAYAEDVIGTQLNGVSSNQTAGRTEGFTVTVKNNSNQGVVDVHITFVIKMTGLRSDQVRMLRTLPLHELSRTDNGDSIVVTDNTPIDFLAGSKSVSVPFNIQFLSGSPSGKVTLTAESVKNTTVLGRDSTTISLKGAGVVTTSGPSKTSEPPVTADPASLIPGGNQTGFPPIQGEAVPLGSSSGIPTGLYVMGALLVGVGGAILWMLFRQRQPAAEEAFVTDEYSPVPSLGYPTGRASASTALPPLGQPGQPRPAGPPANLHPTTPLPTVRGPHTVQNPQLGRTNPPPVDPWADGTGR